MLFFFFKQKTAYEILRSDWSSDVCSSDLGGRAESIDHVHPRSRGGAHSWDNVVAACRRCNASKRDRLLSETTFRLSRPPAEPPHGSWVALSVPRAGTSSRSGAGR